MQTVKAVTHVRFNIFPDGGVSRLRLFGSISADGRLKAALSCLNTMPREKAEAELRGCCGSTRWVEEMLSRRPFRQPADLGNASDEIWWRLDREDWLEAFRAHPRIGVKAAHQWSKEEQAGIERADVKQLAELADANRVYESHFGYIFIVCASGKTTDEMLAILRERLQNDPGHEVRVAAEEQRRITRLRLDKLLQL